MKFLMSYSGGKDSALAMYRMIKAGHEPVAFTTTINIKQGRSWFHGIQLELLDTLSDSLGIPFIPCECEPDQYTQALEDGLAKGKALGAAACVFGDIDIDGHRTWNTERCERLGLECIMPLWQESRESLTREVIELGFIALVKVIMTEYLDESFLGKRLDHALVERIKAAGADPCGENGEYHTFVCDGPIFKRPIAVEPGEIIDFGRHKAIDLRCRG